MPIDILVVEDEISVNRHISEFISDLGEPFRLIGSAVSAARALDYFRSCPVHIMLLDIRMPQMGGLELMELVREKWPDTKVIIISGYDDFKYAQKAMQLGGIDYLLKPLKQEQLVSRLTQVADELYGGASVYTNLLTNQEKWDMRLVELEAELFDQVELGNARGAGTSAANLMRAFADKVGRDPLRLLPFVFDSLLALNKRLSALTVGDIAGAMETRWQTMREALAPQRSADEIEAHVVRFVVDSAALVHHFRRRTSPDVLHRCRELIAKHYVRELPLDEMAGLLGVTPSYLSRLFKKELGVNYTEYVARLRIGKAKELLRQPHLKIMEIAGMVGYNNAHYFSKMFKRHAGMTPQEYREGAGEGGL